MPEAKEKQKEISEGAAEARNASGTPDAEKPSYYYDDAHGYEDFDPVDDAEESD